MGERDLYSETPSDATIPFLVAEGPQNREAIQVEKIFNIGQAGMNHLVLDGETVSPRHARIEWRDGKYILRDMRSQNGTWLNGIQVIEAVLQENDLIQIGAFHFRFCNEIRKSDLNSRNVLWQRQLDILPLMAHSGLPILILGPSGTGKEVLARSIHEQSTRRHGPLVTINCSALSESLIESELFGHTKGSFTGATNDRKGAFEAARGGTLFLDEIGDLPLSLQPKLLRALENAEIRPVGSDRNIRVDVRIIAATHKSLPDQVRNGLFRQDLYFRLNVCRLTPPALRERMEDFESLLYGFAKEQRVRFSHGAIARLKKHSWPGNIRELKNTVARARAYYPGHHVTEEHVEQLIDPSLEMTELGALGFSSSAGPRPVIKEIEKNLIVQSLIQNRGNQRRTAAELGMPKSTLHDRIRSYDIKIDELLSQTQH